jgi:hypothetical protein
VTTEANNGQGKSTENGERGFGGAGQQGLASVHQLFPAKFNCKRCGWWPTNPSALASCRCGEGPLCLGCYFTSHRPKCSEARSKVEMADGSMVKEAE